MRIDSGNKIQQPGNNDELGAVILSNDLYDILTPSKQPGQNKQTAIAQVADKSQHVEHVARIGSVHLTPHGKAQRKHAYDGDEEKNRSNPATLQQVAEPGDQPTGNQDNPS